MKVSSVLIDNVKAKLHQHEQYKSIACDYFGGQLVAAGDW